MRTHSIRDRWFVACAQPRRGLIALLLGTTLAACSADDLLKAESDIITPDQAANPAGALARRGAALRAIAIMTAGGPQVRAWLMDALFTDQLINARSDFNDYDQRQFAPETNPHGVNVWDDYGLVMHTVPTAIAALREFLPDDDTRNQHIGELYSVRGFATTIIAEMYCNGSTFTSFDDAGAPVYDMKLYNNAELYEMAVADFDSALTSFPANSALRRMARVGKARALVNLNRYAEAAAVVRAGGDGAASAEVPTNYVYNITYLQGAVYNVIPDYILNANFGLPLNDTRTGTGREGINGLDYGADARIRKQPFLRNGQDGNTPIYPPGVPWSETFNSAFPLTSGIEARLIEAEAELAAGDASWLTTLNEIRSRNIDLAGQPVPAPLSPLALPATEDASVDLIFEERAMWMYLTIHRWGDMRRLIRQYGRTQDKVFPTGAYFKGGAYGTQVVAEPLPAERNHPAFTGCINLDA